MNVKVGGVVIKTLSFRVRKVCPYLDKLINLSFLAHKELIYPSFIGTCHKELSM